MRVSIRVLIEKERKGTELQVVRSGRCTMHDARCTADHISYICPLAVAVSRHFVRRAICFHCNRNYACPGFQDSSKMNFSMPSPSLARRTLIKLETESINASPFTTNHPLQYVPLQVLVLYSPFHPSPFSSFASPSPSSSSPPLAMTGSPNSFAGTSD